ncbi:MAG: anthranilate synthase component I [Victivallaceae bacterium]
MFKPDYQEFEKLCSTGNVIPVYKEYLADLDTPVSVLGRFANDENMFLLESVEGGERWARFSFIGLNPYAIFRVKDGQPELIKDGKTEILPVSPDGPLATLRDLLELNRPVELPDLPRFFAGAIGYLGYNTVREFERLPEPKTPLQSPTSCLMLTDQMIIFDNIRHTLKIVCCARPENFSSLKAAYDNACEQIGRIEKTLRKPMPEIDDSVSSAFKPEDIKSNMTQEEFCAMVGAAKKHIENGDIIQVVLSQRFSTKLNVQPIQLYRALRLINPSPYMFFLKFGQEKILVGSSPEIMVRKNGTKATVRPIAGTRPRGKTEQEDRALADELLQDIKERAEHLMLVDLGRNDLGRVATPASVQVKDFMTVERYSHVMHLVSNIEAEMRPDKDAFDLVRATFPAGTLSGAPKIRAMEIISELEPEPREVYGGAVGYFGYNGNTDTAITIRTFEIDGDTVAVQAGAGIVYDSDPETEYMETKHKAGALFKALHMAANKLEV